MSWNPRQYALDSDDEDESVAVYAPGVGFAPQQPYVPASPGAPLPPTYTQYYVDPAQRVVATSSGYAPEAQAVFNPQVNPVQYLSSRLPMPALPSPVGVAVAHHQPMQLQQAPSTVNPQAAQLETELSCTFDIPSKELRQTREDLGAEMADHSRWGIGAGAGVAADLTVAPESGTQLDYGPVAVSSPSYTGTLYDQGFISLGAVPVINAGKFKDPYTGVEYNAYESALPPPDADYEETLNASARNVKLAHLQGGWTDNTPRPTKVEVVEDDFHMQYDRSINTYGTYDPSRYVEMFERNNRFTRDDEHPDPDGPELVGVPANMDGNQNVKIRPLPYLPPTNRGKWAETTFRDGIDPKAAVGNSEMMVARTYTKFPCARMENTRMDGGGMEVTQNTMGMMDTQMAEGRRDIRPTQRSTTEALAPSMGPANYVRLASNVGTATYEPSTRFTGTVMYDDQYGSHGALVQASQLNDGFVEVSTGYNGTHEVAVAQIGTIQPEGEATALRNQILEMPHVNTGTVMMDPMGVIGATQMTHDGATAQQLRTQRVEANWNAKNGMTVYTDAYGSYGGDEVQAQTQGYSSKSFNALNSKNGVTYYTDAYGSYGGDMTHGSQTVPGSYAKQDLTKRQQLLAVQTGSDTTYGRNTSQPSVARRSRFNNKKGPAIDFLMPSGSIEGTNGTLNGSQNYAASVRLNSKRSNTYDGRWGFDVQAAQPADSTVWYGHYNQTMEHMNMRPYGNMVHAIAPASSALFMQQRECEA